MAKAFSIRDFMEDVRQQGDDSDIYEKVSVFDIQPNEDNFYKISNIEQLKNSIFSMGGVQQNLLLVKQPVNEKYKYKAVAGHRRIRACIELVQEGNKEFEYVPAVIKENIDNDTEDMLLIMTNGTQRELTDWEKVMQHMKLKEMIPKMKKRRGLDGKTRTLEADYLGVSEGQIAIYNTIGTRLDSWLMSMFKEGAIGISLAYEAAKLEPKMQKQLVQITINKGGFSEEDIKKLHGSSSIKGQMKIRKDQEEKEETTKVTESDTCESVQNKPAPVAEKVTDSVTSENEEKEPVCVPAAVGEKASVAPVEHIGNLSKSDRSVEIPKHVHLRGGYTLDMVDAQITKYKGYISRDGDCHRLGNYRCLLDGLELLKMNLLTHKENEACEDEDI